MTRPDATLSKVGYNLRTKYYHRVRFSGGFYTARCEPGTRVTHFADPEDTETMVRQPCKRCYPKGAPSPEDKLEVIKEKLEEAVTTPIMNDQQQANVIIGFWNWLVTYLL